MGHRRDLARDRDAAKGSFDYSLLDRQVAAARANGARPLLVLGMTPEFHAKRRNDSGLYGDGSVSAPKMWAWKRYVRNVVTRYSGKMDYQVWNEANVSGFWSGTHAQMATLTKVTSKIVNANDRKAKVVAPALATRLTGQRKWLRDFYASGPAASRVASWVDVVSLNLYPLPKQGPEHSMTLLEAARTSCRPSGPQAHLEHRDQLRAADRRRRHGEGHLEAQGGRLRRADVRAQRGEQRQARLLVLLGAPDLANTQLTPDDGER